VLLRKLPSEAPDAPPSAPATRLLLQYVRIENFLVLLMSALINASIVSVRVAVLPLVMRTACRVEAVAYIAGCQYCCHACLLAVMVGPVQYSTMSCVS
jgi:hypothetical protein